MRSIKLGCLRSWYSWFSFESSQQGGVHGLVHGVWTCDAKVLEYWMISSLKIKLNCSRKFWRNWNVPLVLLERPWRGRFYGIYLIRFGFRMWEVLIFKWFLLLKIQINSPKTRLWKQKSVEGLEGLPFNSSMISFHIWLFKKSIHTLHAP